MSLVLWVGGWMDGWSSMGESASSCKQILNKYMYYSKRIGRHQKASVQSLPK